MRCRLTELDAGVLLADLVALLVGEEHVGGETTLGRVGICNMSTSAHDAVTRDLTLLLLASIGLLALAAGNLLGLRHVVVLRGLLAGGCGKVKVYSSGEHSRRLNDTKTK